MAAVQRAEPAMDRRTQDALREEFLRALIDSDETGHEPAVAKSRWSALGTSRLALMGVALVAGGMAAFLVLQGGGPEAQPTPQPVVEAVIAEPVLEPRTQILVARDAIGVGQRLTASSFGWEEWPEGAVRPEFITVATKPEALTELSGAVARHDFFPGEPIREAKLANSGQGLLSAILDTGMRGVSVSVAAESAAGGFIVPGDHVDVVLTRPSAGATSQRSETVLHNVKVLAINARLGATGPVAKTDDPTEEAGSEVFSDLAIATLALDSGAAEVIINATSIGRLSLVLRPVADTAQPAPSGPDTVNQAIRIASPFWAR